MESNVLRFLKESGIEPGFHVVLHGSFSRIRQATDCDSPELFLRILTQYLTTQGSLIIPSFTYTFKGNKNGEVFNPDHSIPKTGVISEVFRKMDGVRRTYSPTHSFCIWGYFNQLIRHDISPESPLGWGSPLSYLLGNKDSHILMLGTDFSSLSFIHFLEVYFNLGYVNIFPWRHVGIEPVGVSVWGEQKLNEVPGCSKSFTNLELSLEDDGYYVSHDYNGMIYKLINVRGLLFFSTSFMKDHYRSLLCIDQDCRACSYRRAKLKEIETLHEL